MLDAGKQILGVFGTSSKENESRIASYPSDLAAIPAELHARIFVEDAPSDLWCSASYEISRALLRFLSGVMVGERGRDADPTLRNAIEIRHGAVRNPRFLTFQKRAADYPHAAAGG